jgi:hypothetical protein
MQHVDVVLFLSISMNVLTIPFNYELPENLTYYLCSMNCAVPVTSTVLYHVPHHTLQL